jgi:hypothetical protein
MSGISSGLDLLNFGGLGLISFGDLTILAVLGLTISLFVAGLPLGLVVLSGCAAGFVIIFLFVDGLPLGRVAICSINIIT